MSRWAESRFRNAGRINFSSGNVPERLSEARKREERELRAMASVNRVFLLGNLGADPDLKFTESGKAFCSLSLATTDHWTDKDGRKQQRTEWHKVKVWGKQAENCKKYLQKGSSIHVEGRISTSRWTDTEGREHYSTEIVTEDIKFISSPPSQRAQQTPSHFNHESDEPSFRHRGL